MVKPRVIKSGKSQWQPVAIDPSVFTSNDLEGIVGIEELTDYTIGGVKIPKRSKVKSGSNKSSSENQKSENPSSVRKEEKLKKKRKPKKKKKKAVIDEDSSGASSETVLKRKPENSNLESESDDLSQRMSLWNGLGVLPVLLRALSDKSFNAPTKIQALTLPAAIFGRKDILGAAETGSGKTLAFGLPILNGILQHMSKVQGEKKADAEQGMSLAEQGFESLDEKEDDEDGNEDTSNELASDEDEIDSNFGENAVPVAENLNDFDGTAQCVNVIDNIEFDFPTTGKGSSKCQYSPKPLYALILTPTRELAVQIAQHLNSAAKYTKITISVVVGGLASQKQERLLNRGPEIVVATPGRLWELIEEGHPHLTQIDTLKYLAIDETDRMLEKGHFEELQRILDKINENETLRQKRQNFVFSATLTMTHEPPRYVMKKKGKKKEKGKPEPTRLTPAQKLADIMKRVGLTNPKIVDITDASGVAQLLTEAQIICTLDEKDYYLYYFLQRHPGRTLVFCNSIEAVRRLTQLFTLLGCSPSPLHAKMHQKHRLKNLERFCGNSQGVLLATDVAARGLDIPHVQHVIHYQTPRTAEGYVHRSGRTARAQQEGLTVLLVEPSEVSLLTRLFRTLGRDASLPSFPVEDEWMSSVKQRVDLARRLDKMELQARRINTEHGWFDKVVKEMDLEISDEDLPTSYSREGGNKVKKQAAVYRKQLAALLSKPLFPKGFSSKYPTQTGKLVVPLFPGSLTVKTDTCEDNAVHALKQSLEQEKALKRKRNNERSKRKKRNKRMKKQESSIEEGQPQSGDEESSAEDD